MTHRESSSFRAACLLVATLFSLALAALDRARAQPPLEQPQLSIVIPGELRSGAHLTVVLRLSLPQGTAEPILVTPFREGEAIEVVRGRLLRSDARAVQGGLEFDLPLRTHSAGSAVLGARVLAYVCNQVCRKVSVEARANVVVLPP